MSINLGRVQRAVGTALMAGGLAVPLVEARGALGGFAAVVVLGGHAKAGLALAFISTGSLLLGYLAYANARHRRLPGAVVVVDQMEVVASRQPRPAAARALFAERSDVPSSDDHVGHEARPARLM